MNVLKRIFVHNLTTKIMALFMAVALWTYAYFFSLQETDHDVPVVIRAPQGWSVLEQNPTRLRVRIEYPRHSSAEVKDALAANEIIAEYAVATAPANPIQPFAGVPITSSNFRLPSGAGARIASWNQEQVSFTLAKEETRSLPVKLQLAEPPPGYVMSDQPWYDPHTVQVTGPSEALRRADCVYTDEIRIVAPPRNAPLPEGVIDIRPYIEVNIDGKRAKFDIGCSEKIKFRLYLAEVSRERVFDKVRIMVVEPPGYAHQVKLKQTEMRVTVRGPEKEIEAIKPEDIQLLVNVSSLEPGPTPYPQPVTCEIRGVANPAQLKVELEQPTVGVDVGPT